MFSVSLVLVVGVVFLLVLPDGGVPGGVFLGMGALQVLFLFCWRNQVNLAAGLLNLAMQALRDFPSLVLAGILINMLVLVVYIIYMVFIISAFSNIGYTPVTGEAVLAAETPPVILFQTSTEIEPSTNYCVAGQTTFARVCMYIFAAMLLWLTATLEAVRMAIVSAVFGAFYYFAADDPEKPSGIVCTATTWAFTKQLGTHAISGMVLAIIDQLKRMAKSRSQGIIGAIVRMVVLCVLSMIEQLSKFLVVMTGLTGLSFWDSATRTLTIMKEVFVDGYITSKITTR